jgi:peptide/nickel transport system permease protein
MYQYVVRRLGFSLVVVFLVLLLTFLLVNAMPGDVIESRLSGSGLTQEQIADYKRQAGLDRPLYVQFVSWLGDLARGDMGKSFFTGQSVAADLKDRLPATLQLGLFALIVGMIIAIPLGTVSAVWPGTPIDYASRLLAIVGLAIPNFFLALVAILVASRWFGYFPPLGFSMIWEDPMRNLEKLWMPVLVLSVQQSAGVARMIRSSLLEVLRSDYIRTARSKGLAERTTIFRHAFRNAMIPVITIMGLQASAVIGGAVIIEILFGIPGMGDMIVNSVVRRDFVPLQGAVLVFALVLVMVNLLVDLSYTWLDPRISY